jgi:predicted ATPase
MITLVEALRYRSLRDVRQELSGFQVLVGANASGKSTFLDVVHLIRDLLNDGLASAIAKRSPDIRSLLWMELDTRFEVAVEFDIPPERRERLSQNGQSRARYEVALGLNASAELAIAGENLWLLPARQTTEPIPRPLFPGLAEPRSNLLHKEGHRTPPGWKKIVAKSAGNDYFVSEGGKWRSQFRIGPQKLALANLPEDESRFPVATWVKRSLMEGIQLLVLNSERMRRPSPPGSPKDFQPDGSNLPWAIESLRGNTSRFESWVAHIRTALPDIKSIDTVEREEDRHRYLRIEYQSGLRAPSWTVSDGTLRLLALTLIGYLEGGEHIYLVEEPENGIHPQAVETVFQSMSSAYGNQILCASHSPILLSLAEPKDILCFARTPEGATDIVRGDLHPRLRDWKRESDLGTLFATGILG